MEVCRLEVLLQYMKRDINKLILLSYIKYKAVVKTSLVVEKHCVVYKINID